MASKKMYLVGLLLALFVGPLVVSAIKCVVCNNADDADCEHGEDVDKTNYLKDCDSLEHSAEGSRGQKYAYCRKIVTFIDFDVGSNKATERIVRKCGYKKFPEKYIDECYYRGGFGGRQTVCTCETDGCNSGFTFSANHSLMALSIFTAIFTGLKQL